MERRLRPYHRRCSCHNERPAWEGNQESPLRSVPIWWTRNAPVQDLVWRNQNSARVEETEKERQAEQVCPDWHRSEPNQPVLIYLFLGIVRVEMNCEFYRNKRQRHRSNKRTICKRVIWWPGISSGSFKSITNGLNIHHRNQGWKHRLPILQCGATWFKIPRVRRIFRRSGAVHLRRMRVWIWITGGCWGILRFGSD